MKINVKTMKMLKECQGRKDVRGWMECIHIYKDGFAATTNGHTAFLSEKLDGEPISGDLVVKVEWTSFTGVAHYSIDEERSQFVGMNKDDKPVQFIPYEVVDFKIMDIKALFRMHEPSDTGCVCVDPHYMKLMSNFDKGSTVLFKTGKSGTPSLIIGDIGTYLLMSQTYADKSLPEIVE